MLLVKHSRGKITVDGLNRYNRSGATEFHLRSIRKEYDLSLLNEIPILFYIKVCRTCHSNAITPRKDTRRVISSTSRWLIDAQYIPRNVSYAEIAYGSTTISLLTANGRSILRSNVLYAAANLSGDRRNYGIRYRHARTMYGVSRLIPRVPDNSDLREKTRVEGVQ